MAEQGSLGYSSQSEDDEWVPRSCYQFSRRRKHGSQPKKCKTEVRFHENAHSKKETLRRWACKKNQKFATASKSCENIYFTEVRSRNSSRKNNGWIKKTADVRGNERYAWGLSSRSEEHISYFSIKPKPCKEQKCNWSLPSLHAGGRKNGALSFLGKMSSKQNKGPASPTSMDHFFTPQPWILVEFSEDQNVLNSGSENESDHSFEMAVAEVEERKLKPPILNHSGYECFSSFTANRTKNPMPLGISAQKNDSSRLMKSESVTRHCLAPKEEEKNSSCGLQLVVVPRPLTLGIRGKLAIPAGQRACEASSGKLSEGPEVEGATGEMLPARNVPRMPSLESIGSCSLDADMTASECSEAVGITASQRTLHSISFVDFSPLRATEDGGVSSGVGASDKTERTTDNQPSPRPSSPSAATSPRPPSYVSLSCSISGYSPLAAYDSELRKGFRSGRDVIQSSESAFIPVKQTSTGDQEYNNTQNSSVEATMENNKPSICSPNHRKPCVGARDMNGSLQSDTNGRGSESEISSHRSGQSESVVGAVRVVQFTSQNKSYVRTVTRTFDSVSAQGTSIIEEHSSSSNFATPSKSFVQQRVERLYGPGALAQGFFKRTSHRGLSLTGKAASFSEQNDDVIAPRPCASLPVLRHLRPEFRNQLPVRGTSPKVPPVVTIIPITVEGSESPSVNNEDLSLNHITEKEIVNGSEVTDIIVTALPDLCPAAPDVVLPVVPVEGVADVATNGVVTSEDHLPIDGEVKDGHYFIRLLKSEIARLTTFVESAEKELQDGAEGKILLPEEASGWLRSAAGQARLLMRQKMQQFEGLCQKHLLQSPGEAFPTTIEDLAGFWDMVLLQVASVDTMFQEIDRLRASGWVDTPGRDKPDGKGDSLSSSAAVTESETAKKRTTVRRAIGTPTTGVSGKATGASKARDEARRKMMEERRRAMRERQKEAAGESNACGEVEIFVPDNK